MTPRLSALRRRFDPAVERGFGALARLRSGRAEVGPAEGPIVNVGFFRSALGIGEGARRFSEALRAEGAAVIDWDVTALFGRPEDVPWEADRSPPPGPAHAVVHHLNPPQLTRLFARLGRAARVRGRQVGWWAWETTVAPKSWRQALPLVDEIWAPSRFNAEAFRALAPATPVRHVPHAQHRFVPGRPDRARFGLPEDAAVVLCAFDLRSVETRKNPRAALDAFESARVRAGVEATLVCKASGGDARPGDLAALRDAFGPEVRFVTQPLEPEGVRDLIASADVLLSLHRAEGFGFWLSDALWSGVPVVATHWSGNTDFCPEGPGAVPAARLVPAREPLGIYRTGLWAEPDVAAAAAALADLLHDRAHRRREGERGARHVRRVLSREAWRTHLDAAGLTLPAAIRAGDTS